MKPASWAEKVTAQQDGSENRSKFASRIFKDTRCTAMRGHICMSHLYDALFSATATSCGENRNRKSFRQSNSSSSSSSKKSLYTAPLDRVTSAPPSRLSLRNRCCRNVHNKQERLDLDLIILIMSLWLSCGHGTVYHRMSRCHHRCRRCSITSRQFHSLEALLAHDNFPPLLLCLFCAVSSQPSDFLYDDDDFIFKTTIN